MRVVVVDDEKKMRDEIADYLKTFEREQKVSVIAQVYESPEDFLEHFQKDADRIRQDDKEVLLMFITNMAQYALHGYEVEAIDYVIKPLGYQEFALKMKKAMRYMGRHEKKQMMLQTTDGIQPVAIEDILYVEVIRHYLQYHTTGQVYEVRGAMKEAEEELERYHFVRCNQSYLVNLAKVACLHGNTVTVGSDQLPISRNKKTAFVDALTRYIGGMA